MRREKREETIEVRGNRGIRPQRRQLARDLTQCDARAPGGCGHTRSVALPRLEQTIERLEIAQVAGFAEGAVKGCNLPGTDRLRVPAGKPEVWRSEQRDGRHARKIRADEGEQDVERGGIWLRRQRQRVEHLGRNTGGAEDISRKIDIRETLTHHERHAIEHRGIACARGGAHPSREACNFFFPIARGVHVPAFAKGFGAAGPAFA